MPVASRFENQRIKKRRGARPGVRRREWRVSRNILQWVFCNHSGVDGMSKSKQDARGTGNVEKYLSVACGEYK